MDCDVEPFSTVEIKIGEGGMWKSLLRGSLFGAIFMEKRLCCNNPPVTATWTTGDSVLSRFPSVNWPRREYVVEEVGEFLNAANPTHRHIVIGDSEQLSETCSTVVCSMGARRPSAVTGRE